VRENDVEWKMYITKSGVGGFNELLWFEGTSYLDGMDGQWTLYLSHEHYDKFLQIDWSRTSDSIGQIKYTNIRNLNDQGSPNLLKGSYIQAGYQDDYYDAYYNIHIYESTQLDFTDTYIEWSTTEYDGHVKSAFKFKNDLWHCWDSLGYDITCTSN
jgi:hypothetical protein